ncbi:hypothetical protein Hdeb2414_s0298g00860501 [Helianthus debilis subsp. tardiflorus]
MVVTVMVCEIRHLSYDVWQEWTALVTVMVCEIRHLSYDVWQEWTALVKDYSFFKVFIMIIVCET